MLEVGQLLVTVVGSYLSYTTTSLVAAATSVVAFSALIWCPESPYFFLQKGKIEKAKRSLKQLRYGSISKELDQIHQKVKEDMEKKSSVKDLLFHKGYRWELFIVLGMIFIVINF